MQLFHSSVQLLHGRGRISLVEMLGILLAFLLLAVASLRDGRRLKSALLRIRTLEERLDSYDYDMPSLAAVSGHLQADPVPAPMTADVVDSWVIERAAIGVPPSPDEIALQKRMWDEEGMG